MKLYTKTGDCCETVLLNGKKECKCCVCFQVVGEIDELNAAIGLVVANLNVSLRGAAQERRSNPIADKKGFTLLIGFLQSIQRDLFKAGAEVVSLQSEIKCTGLIQQSQIRQLEKRIDEYWAELPEIKNFILPGGSVVGAHLHHARTVCRRVERALVSFGKQKKVRPELYQYFNRLSDFFFAAARWVNFKKGEKEIEA